MAHGAAFYAEITPELSTVKGSTDPKCCTIALMGLPARAVHWVCWLWEAHQDQSSSCDLSKFLLATWLPPSVLQLCLLDYAETPALPQPEDRVWTTCKLEASYACEPVPKGSLLSLTVKKLV